MRLLLDSHVFVWLAELSGDLPKSFFDLIVQPDVEIWLSAVSLWELRLKLSRRRDFALKGTLEELADTVLQGGENFLNVTRAHALHELPDMPETADPFDRMLLAQCAVENMRLLTVDAALKGHRLAWKPQSA